MHSPIEAKLVDKCPVEDQVCASHLQGLISNMPSATPCIPEDCCIVSGLSKKDLITAENKPSASVLLDVENNHRECIHRQNCFAECHNIVSGFQTIIDTVLETWQVESPAGLKYRFLTDFLMDVCTVSVYWAQSLSVSADGQRKDTYPHVGSVCSLGSQREDPGGNATTACSGNSNGDDIDLGFLASMLVPQTKILAEYYHKSLGSNLRRGLHEAKLMEFTGFGPDPAPNWVACETVEILSRCSQIGCVQGILNPLFERMWLPWAQRAQFYHHRDVAMVCNQELLHSGLHLKKIANICLSWAVPTRPVLEYMISMAPNGKIAEIGSGLGYWAALLKNSGADIVAVDDFSEFTSQGSLYFPETIPMDGEEFIRQGGAVGRALFFCWPLKSHTQKFTLSSACKPIYQTCFVEGCLKAFHGDTVFFVGEKDDGCTFDMGTWMQGSSKHRRTWRLEKEMEIPTWPGVHDVFMCFVKHKDACVLSAGKKKKRAVKKAQLGEEAHVFLSERYAKEEGSLKASIAAYPECSQQ